MLFRDSGYLQASAIQCRDCDNLIRSPNVYHNICLTCEELIMNGQSNLRGQNIFLCEACSKLSERCMMCNMSNSPEKSPAGTSIVSVTQVNCLKKRKKCDNSATYFVKNSMLTYCEQCQEKYNLTSKKENKIKNTLDLYQDLTESLEIFYKNNYKMLCPERRKIFITYTMQELLEANRWALECSIIKCVRHKYMQAVCIDDDFCTFCSQCSSSLVGNLPIDLAEIISKATDLCKKIESKYLNKFMLKLVKKSANTNSKNFVNILLLECRDLIANKLVEQVRCVNCYVKVSMGRKTGLLNKCGHCICYQCLLIGEIECCPIDRSDFENLRYAETLELELIPDCHCNHSLVNHEGDVFKLPCFHYSCEEDLKYQKCLTCGNDFNLFDRKCKNDKNMKNLIEFCSISCLEHQKKCVNFNYRNSLFACENCDNFMSDQLENVQDKNNFAWAVQLLNTRFKYLIGNKRELSTKYIMVTKEISYYKLLSYQARFELYQKVCTLFSLSFHTNFDSYQEKRRFKNRFSGRSTTQKIWEIKENTVSGFTITAQKDCLLGGLIIFSRCAYNNIYDYVPVYSYIVSVKLIKRQCELPSNPLLKSDQIVYATGEVMADASYILNETGEENKFCFGKPILLSSENVSYDIVLQLYPGLYYHGVPYNQIPNDLLRISRLKSIPEGFETIGNDSIGGPIAGFLIKELS